MRNVWYQPDGGTAYTVRTSIAVLRVIFPAQIFSQHGDVLWLPRSLDLSTCDSFLWAYLNAHVYESKPLMLNALKNEICEKIAQIDRQLFERVEGNFHDRLRHCIHGYRLKDLNF